jgi:hypothetical protein
MGTKVITLGRVDVDPDGKKKIIHGYIYAATIPEGVSIFCATEKSSVMNCIFEGSAKEKSKIEGR